MSLSLLALGPTSVALLCAAITLTVTIIAIVACQAYGVVLSPIAAAAGAGLVALSSLASAQALGPALLGAALGCGLLALAVIDAHLHRLPDSITLPLIVIGLVAAWIEQADLPASQIAGAVIGYASLAVIDWLYRLVRGRDGLGLGDAKLLAAAGAWLGWRPLPAVVLVACACGGIVLIIYAMRGRRSTALSSLPFGPVLAIGIWLGFLAQRVFPDQTGI